MEISDLFKEGNLFFVIMFIIGVILTATSMNIDQNIENTCASNKLRKANKGLLIIGVTFIVGAISYMICQWKAGGTSFGGTEMHIYMAFGLVLSLVLLVLTSIIQAESKDSCDTKGSSTFVLVVSVITVTLILGYSGYNFYKSKEGGTSLYRYSLRSSG